MGFTEAWHSLEQAVGNFVSRPAERPFNGVVPVTPGQGGMPAGLPFVPEASYFSVRLVEMNLANGGQYFADFLPLGVCLSEYTSGSERQRRPMILSNDVINAQLQSAGAKAGYVEYKDVYAVRRAPVKPDNLTLFVGLFRMPYNDLAKQVLQIAADMTDQVGAGVAVSQGLHIAEKIYDRVAGLFKLNVLSPRLGYANGNALTESGYFLVAGPAAPTLTAESLSVANNRLHWDTGSGPQPASGFDYLLVALEHTPTLLPQGDANVNLMTDLPFHKRWREVTKLLALCKVEEAEAEMPQLRSEVVVSSDLTEDDRLVAIAAYDTAYEKYRDVLVKPAKGTNGTRGARSGDPVAGLRREADARSRAGQAEAGRVLGHMADRLNELEAPPDPARPDDLFLREAGALREAIVTGGPAGTRVSAQVAEAISAGVSAGPN